jgi:hypothetical protein
MRLKKLEQVFAIVRHASQRQVREISARRSGNHKILHSSFAASCAAHVAPTSRVY